MKLFLILIIFLAINTSYSQILWNGIYSFEMKKGGDESSELTNDIRNGNFTIYPGKLQLFIDAEIERDKIYFNSKIEANTNKSLKINPITIYQISVSFINLFDKDFNIEVGKILTPFGRFPKLQHAFDNPFISFPLSHRYYTPLSRINGFNGFTLTQRLANQNDPGLQIVYHGTYFTGVKLFGSLFNNNLLYDFAITNTSISNYWSDLELNKQPAYTGRISFEPEPWINIGGSFSTGAFMDETPANSSLDVNKYKQTVFGADLNLNYSYYDLTFEYINNKWNAPYFQPGMSGVLVLVNNDLNFQINSVFTSFKVDLPFIVGSYLAVKYEMMNFNEVDFGNNNKSKWYANLNSYEIAAGYKLSPRTLLKLSYQKNNKDITPEPEDDVLGMQISVGF